MDNKTKFLIDDLLFNREDYNDEEWGLLISNSSSVGFIQYMTYEEVKEQFSHLLSPDQLSQLKSQLDPEEVVILQTEINDEVIAQLDQVEETDFELKQAIDAYEIVLKREGKEILKKGTYYVVCEDAIYIAVREDEYQED